MLDYVTVWHCDKNTGKYYSLDSNKKVIKTAAANCGSAWAVTHTVNSPYDMAKLIKEVSTAPNQALILGFVKGCEDDTVPFRILSVRDFKALAKQHLIKLKKYHAEPIEIDGVKYATRTKRMFTGSTWFLFDRDRVEGTPIELEPDATTERWKELLDEKFPEVANCGYVQVESASSRVRFNGEPIAKGNSHIYMQCQDGTDVERFGKAALISSFDRACGFMRPVYEKSSGLEIAQRPWTLFDVTTFSSERLCFDGSPVVDTLYPDLTIRASEPLVFDGGRVNTRALGTPTKVAQDGLGLNMSINSAGRVTTKEVNNLVPSTILHIKDESGEESFMTMDEFASDEQVVERFRCQAVFRPESVSWAAYIDKSGSEIFMHDVGTHINHIYNNVKEEFEDAGVVVLELEEDSDVKEDAGVVVLELEDVQADFAIALGLVFAVEVDDTATAEKKEKTVAVSVGTYDRNEEQFGVPESTIIDSDSQVNMPVVGGYMEEGLFIPIEILHGGELNSDMEDTDEANGDRFKKVLGDSFKYCSTHDKWYGWSNNHWEEDCNGEVKTLTKKLFRGLAKMCVLEGKSTESIYQHIKKTLSTAGIKNVIEAAKDLDGVKVGVDCFDAHKDKHLFMVKNGYINMRLLKSVGSVAPVGLVGFSEPDRSIMATMYGNVDYKEGAVCPMWLATLQEVFSQDQTLVDYLQRMVGYTMLGNPVEDITFMLTGDGSNGKSTIMSVIDKLMGSYTESVPKQSLMASRYDTGDRATPNIAKLKGKRMVTISEGKLGDVLDESIVKTLSGSDKISARFLNSNPFTFKPCFVTMMPTNHPPIIRDDGAGIWRRIRKIDFSRNFQLELTEDELDKDLDERIMEHEMSGVLNWALEGAVEYQSNGLQCPAKVRNATEEYKRSMCPLDEWLSECCDSIGDVSRETPLNDLWSSYTTYAKESGEYQIASKKWFSTRLAKIAGLTRLHHCKDAGGVRGFSGIRVKFSGIGG